MERWSLPEGWTNATLDSQLIAVTSGFAYPKSRLALSGFAHLRPFNIGGNGELDLSTIYYIPNNVVSNINDYSLEPGDILFNNTNSVELVGKSAIVRKPLLCTFSNHITRIRVVDRERLDPGWLLLCLRNLWMEGFFAKKCNRWIGQAGFNNSKLAEVIIPLPPLETQRWIVARLDALLAEVAAARRLHAEIAEDTARVMEAVLREVFDPSVTRDWPYCDPLGFLIEIEAPLVDPTKSEFSNLPHIHGGTIEQGTGRLLDYRTVAEDGVHSGKYYFQPDSVLYSKIRPYLRKATVVNFTGLCSADIYPLQVKETRLFPNFLMWALLSEDFTQYAEGLSGRARMPKLNREQLFRYKLRYPDYQEQMRVASILGTVQEETAILQQAQSRELALLTDLEQTILSHAFRGEL